MDRPLHGIRVLELGGYISGPFGTSMLQTLGAEVVKVERPGAGDDFRRGKNEKEKYFRQYNAGKLSLGIDLKSEQGIDVVRRLIPHFDVVVENMRPGKAENLGLGYEDCRALRHDIVYTSVTGFGPDGPMAKRPAYDSIGQAFSGFYSLMGEHGNAQASGVAVADLITGMSALSGVLAGLVRRNSTREAVKVETSLTEAMSVLTIDALTQYYDDGKQDPHLYSRRLQGQNFVLPTRSETSVAVHLSSSEKFWTQLTVALDAEHLAHDPRFLRYADRARHYFELEVALKEIFEQDGYQEWAARLDENDVPFSPVHTMSGYLHHPQVEHLEIAGPEDDGLALVRPPWRFDSGKLTRSPNTPQVGEHTRSLVAEVLPQAEIQELLDAGVLYESMTSLNTAPTVPQGPATDDAYRVVMK